MISVILSVLGFLEWRAHGLERPVDCVVPASSKTSLRAMDLRDRAIEAMRARAVLDRAIMLAREKKEALKKEKTELAITAISYL